MTLNEDRSATLILRVWVEGATGSFRGRLTYMDTSTGQEAEEVTVKVASSTRGMVDGVTAWLDEFIRQTSQPVDRGN